MKCQECNEEMQIVEGIENEYYWCKNCLVSANITHSEYFCRFCKKEIEKKELWNHVAKFHRNSKAEDIFLKTKKTCSKKVH